jgi:hypothetical protein
VILYRKAPPLRIQRAASPAPPFWAATTIAPYSARRASPIAIDYLELRALASERAEVSVCNDVRDELERARQPVDEPALIDAAERAELIFRRGDDALRFCGEQRIAALHLISTDGALPTTTPSSVIAISAWPLDFKRLETLFAAAHGLTWGIAIPVIFPVTTDIAALDRLCDLAQLHGAQFFAAIPVEAGATARKTLAETLIADDESYDLLFHADLEPISIATERHIAALADSIGIADFITPPKWNDRSNWNGAVLLTLVATRMIAMKHEIETGTRLARSARAVAMLDKPIARIAAAASLSIVDALDEISVDMLTEWIDTGRSSFAEHVAKQWRLRRDAGV